MNAIQSISHSKTNRKVFEIVESEGLAGKTLLDVGAGEGYFVRMIGETLKQKYDRSPKDWISACDINPSDFKYNEVICHPANFHETLPFAGNQFDIVTSIEVIEHLEDQFHFIRELHRIAKPEGKAILTTPNILNVNSRIRNFFVGFGLLYDILPLHRIEPTRLSGHIHPISLYYLAYAMYRAGFQRVEVHYDRIKKSGLFLSLLLYPIIWAGSFLYKVKTSSKKKTIYPENAQWIGKINSIATLASRTIIVVGYK